MWNNRKFFKRNMIENKQHIQLRSSGSTLCGARYSQNPTSKLYQRFFLSTYAQSSSHLIWASLQDLMSQLLSVVASTGALDDSDALVCKQRQFSCCTFHN